MNPSTKIQTSPSPTKAPSMLPSDALRPAAFRRQVFRAVLTGTLFFGWLGYLIFLVRTLPHAPNGGPVVLSRPQFLISDLDVIAQVDSLDGPVKIIEVVNPPEDNEILKGKEIRVSNLERCRPLPSGNESDEDPPRDFRGPGRYILPLRSRSLSLLPAVGMMATPWSALPLLAEHNRFKNTKPGLVIYEVAPTPPSPGYPHGTFHRSGPPRIYPDILATRAQLEQIQKLK
jgi:hypothetical protein